MTTQAKPKITRELLAAAFREAREAAEKLAATEDGGTCNFDTAVLRLPRVPAVLVQQAAADAGVRISKRDWYGPAWFLYVSHGQGNRNTSMAEAACRALEAAGLDATVYYQMD